jgi:Na+/H+ antiporter NhaD/arsenite permease-like protein
MLFESIFVLSVVILLIIFKEYILEYFWLKLDNWTVTLFGAFLLILITKRSVSKILKKKVDYATLFFFAWLFVVVWALEYNWVIEKLAEELIVITNWSKSLLLLMFTMWSSILSVFIDNVPYNIAMVSTLESFKSSWVIVWSAWTALAWWLNSCTSIWWAGSPIGSACNVIALWQAEKSKVFINFLKYLMIWVPLVLINSFVAYLILYFRYMI